VTSLTHFGVYFAQAENSNWGIDEFSLGVAGVPAGADAGMLAKLATLATPSPVRGQGRSFRPEGCQVLVSVALA